MRPSAVTHSMAVLPVPSCPGSSCYMVHCRRAAKFALHAEASSVSIWVHRLYMEFVSVCACADAGIQVHIGLLAVTGDGVVQCCHDSNCALWA